MMDKGRFSQSKLGFFRVGVVAHLFLLACCTTGTMPMASITHPLITPDQKQLPELDLRAELSSVEVVAGTITLITVHVPQASPGAVLGNFEGIELPFFPEPDLGHGVYSAVVGVPYDRKPGPGEVVVRLIQAGQPESILQLKLNVLDGHYSSEVLHVNSRRVNPTRAQDLLRIKMEQAEVLEIYTRVTLQKFWRGPFVLPIQSRVTSPFGIRRIYNGQLKNFHPGMDLKAPMKTAIYTAAPGKVVLAKDLFYTGNTVMIDHGYGIITLYAHMNQLAVHLGQMVAEHQLLGLSGKTGRVNGPHLHWQAVVHHVKVNPLGLTQVIR